MEIQSNKANIFIFFVWPGWWDNFTLFTYNIGKAEEFACWLSKISWMCLKLRIEIIRNHIMQRRLLLRFWVSSFLELFCSTFSFTNTLVDSFVSLLTINLILNIYSRLHCRLMPCIVKKKALYLLSAMEQKSDISDLKTIVCLLSQVLKNAWGELRDRSAFRGSACVCLPCLGPSSDSWQRIAAILSYTRVGWSLYFATLGQSGSTDPPQLVKTRARASFFFMKKISHISSSWEARPRVPAGANAL